MARNKPGVTQPQKSNVSGKLKVLLDMALAEMQPMDVMDAEMFSVPLNALKKASIFRRKGFDNNFKCDLDRYTLAQCVEILLCFSKEKERVEPAADLYEVCTDKKGWYQAMSRVFKDQKQFAAMKDEITESQEYLHPKNEAPDYDWGPGAYPQKEFVIICQYMKRLGKPMNCKSFACLWRLLIVILAARIKDCFKFAADLVIEADVRFNCKQMIKIMQGSFGAKKFWTAGFVMSYQREMAVLLWPYIIDKRALAWSSSLRC